MYLYLVLIFLITSEVNTFSYLAHLDFIFHEVPLKSFARFPVEMHVVVFLEFSVQNMNPLLDISFASIFSHLMVSFGE